MIDPWIEAEDKHLPGLLEDLLCELGEDWLNFRWAAGRYPGSDVEMAARLLIRRGRQYLALKRRLQFD